MAQILIIFALLLVAEFVYFKIADKCNIIDKPNERSSHKNITLRGGGIIFYIAIVYFAMLFGFPYPWFLFGLTLITFISFIDDVIGLSSKVRILFHFSAMALMFMQWGLFSGEMPWWYVIIAFIFLLRSLDFARDDICSSTSLGVTSVPGYCQDGICSSVMAGMAG